MQPADTKKEFTTTISAIVSIVIEKYNDLEPEQVKATQANMKGWKKIGESLQDQAKINPSFFN
jgi:hypothetical protein